MIAAYFAVLAALVPVGGDTYDFGEVLAGTQVRHTFAVQNTGDQPLRVVEVRPTCALESVASPALIPPGEVGEFAVALTTDALFGKILRGLTVRLMDGTQEETVLFTITGRVRHPVEITPEGDGGPVIGWMGDRVEQAFGVTFNDPQVSKIEILSADVSAMEGFPLPPVGVTTTSSPDGRTARITLQLDAAALSPGEYGHWLNIRTSHPGVPLAQIPVSWLVRDPVFLSAREIVFHAPSMFNALEVQFPCRGYHDALMKQPLNEPLGGKGFYPLASQGQMQRVTNGSIVAWVPSSCLRSVPPEQVGRTRYVTIADGKGRPLRLGSVVCRHPLVAAFWRQDSPSSCTVGVTLLGEPEQDETVVLEVELASPIRERREIPIRLVRE